MSHVSNHHSRGVELATFQVTVRDPSLLGCGPRSFSQKQHFNNIKVDFNIIEEYFESMPADPNTWFLQLEEEDQQFVKRLVLASGSLKE